MARVQMVMKVTLVVVLYSLMVALPRAVDDPTVTCDLVVSDLAPCATFLTSGGDVPKDCCSGVNSLKDAAKTKDDRQTVCKCAEVTATTLPGINLDNVRSLPGKCGVDFPYEISPDTDCSKVP